MKRYFIDTNILIYAQGAEHKYKEPCQKIMRLIAADEIFGVTNTEVLQEILYRYTCLNKRELGIELVNNSLSIIHEILPVEKEDMLLSISLLKSYRELNVRDAVHAASAFRNNFKYIISVDKHFDRIKGLERVNPINL